MLTDLVPLEVALAGPRFACVEQSDACDAAV